MMYNKGDDVKKTDGTFIESERKEETFLRMRRAGASCLERMRKVALANCTPTQNSPILPPVGIKSNILLH
jgi:hypothetical protein